MIIRSFHIENLLAFENLTIHDIPDSGMICLDSINKSELLESLHFALFGTPLSPTLDKKDLIHPNSHYSASTIDFLHNGEFYQLMRTFDVDGDSDALLLDGHGNLLVENNSIEQQLQDQFFGNKDAFIKQNLFISPPEPVTSYELLEQLELDQFSNAYHELDIQPIAKNNIQATQQAFDDLNLDEAWLPELVDTRETLQDHQLNLKRCGEQVKKLKQSYPDRHKKFHKNNKHFQIFNSLSNILLPITSITWLIWGLFIFAPSFLQTLMPVPLYQTLSNTLPAVLFSVGGVVTVAYGFSLIYSWWLDSKILHPMAKQLKTDMMQLNDDYRISLEQQPPLSKRISAWLSQEPLLASSQTTNDLFTIFCAESKHFEHNAQHVQKLMVSVQNTIKAHKSTIAQYLNQTNDEIEKEMQHSEQAASIRQQLYQQKHQLHEQEQQFAIHQQAKTLLLNTAIEQLEQNHTLINQLLSVLTRGAYRSIHIDDVFSLSLQREQDDLAVNFSDLPALIRQQVNLSIQLAQRLNQENGFIILTNLIDDEQKHQMIESIEQYSSKQQIIFIGHDFDENEENDDVSIKYC